MELQLDPDRLLPADPETRALARSLYDRVADLPIISPHGHVAPSLLRDDAPFSDPTNLLITYDHYVTRLLHAAGVDLAELGAGTAAEADPRAVWRMFCENWHLYYGTASGYWLTHELVTLFGITTEPSAESADALYRRDRPAAGAGRLPSARPVRALRDRGAGDDRRPDGRSRGACRPGGRSDIRRSCAADLPTGCLPRPHRSGIPRAISSASPARPAPHPTTSTATSRR